MSLWMGWAGEGGISFCFVLKLFLWEVIFEDVTLVNPAFGRRASGLLPCLLIQVLQDPRSMINSVGATANQPSSNLASECCWPSDLALLLLLTRLNCLGRSWPGARCCITWRCESYTCNKHAFSHSSISFPLKCHFCSSSSQSETETTFYPTKTSLQINSHLHKDLDESFVSSLVLVAPFFLGPGRCQGLPHVLELDSSIGSTTQTPSKTQAAACPQKKDSSGT